MPDISTERKAREFAARNDKRSCFGKIRYQVRRFAKSRAKDVAKRTGDKLMRAYYCEHCDGYHIGKLSKGVVEGKGYPKR